MHARVTKSRVEPDNVAEALRIVQESILPAARQQPGFRGLTHLVDRAAGNGLTITLWESEADMRAGEASGYYREQIGKVRTLLAVEPTTDAYEVAVQET